jgi:hypothetical protein
MSPIKRRHERLNEVTNGTPEDEHKRDHEEHCEGDPQPSLARLAAGHTDNAHSCNPNAPNRQQDQERHVLRHGHEPGRGPYPPRPETIHTCQRPTAPNTMKNAPRALSPAKRMPIPMTTTTPNTTNNHESRRATHPSFSFTSPTVLVANPGTLPGHTSTSHGELCAVLDPCVFGFVGFIRLTACRY